MVFNNAQPGPKALWTLLSLTIVSLLPESPLSPKESIAWAQSPRRPPPQSERTLAIVAEQAFASLDYATAFRAGQQVLVENPKNIAIRRIAAASALQLKRPVDCLRLLSALTPKETNSDDLHLMGECSLGVGSFSPFVLRTLDQSKNVTEKSDAANYWLGVAAYRDGNYAGAKRLLDAVVLLPARFDDQKKFMLERIADLMSAATAAPQSPSGPNATGVSGSQTPSATPSSSAAASSSASTSSSGATTGSERRKRPETGWFRSFVGEAKVGGAAGILDKTGTGLKEQPEFDKEVEDALREKRAVNNTTIEERSGTLVSPVASVNSKVMTGYRSDDFTGERGTEFGLGLSLSGTYSSVSSTFYAVQDTRMHPSATVAFPAPGGGLRLSTHFEQKPNANLGYRIEMYADRLATRWDQQYGQVGAQGRVTLQTRSFFFGLGGFWSVLQGPDLGLGGHWNGVELDAGLTNMGAFALRAPLGHSLLSYQVTSPIPTSRTTGVFQIVSLEGRYFELNLAPSLALSSDLRALLWYRFVSGAERSYIASTTQTLQISKDDYSVKYPDSQYDSTLSDLSAAIEYTPWSWGGLLGGVTASFYRTVYKFYDIPSNPSTTSTSPFMYSPLLDRGKQNFTLGFISLYSKF